MVLDKSKQLCIYVILAISFLIESPLRRMVISLLSFLNPLPYLIVSITFYIAIFVCILILIKSKITLKAIIKSICLTVAFLLFEQIMSILLFSEILALLYEIIRPLLVLFVVFLANRWILKFKFDFDKLSLFILCVAFLLGAVCNAIAYIRIVTYSESIGNSLFSYLTILTDDKNSIYYILSTLCSYTFVFISLTKNKVMCPKTED